MSVCLDLSALPKQSIIVLSTALIVSTLVACSDGDNADAFPDENTPGIPGAPANPAIPSTPGDPAVNPVTNPPPIAGDVSLRCSGNQVWSLGLNEKFPQFEELISEGGAEFNISPDSADPCAVLWLYDASQNCSLLYSIEGFFEKVRDEPVPSPYRLAIVGADLSITAGTEIITAPASGISFQQIALAPDCP